MTSALPIECSQPGRSVDRPLLTSASTIPTTAAATPITSPAVMSQIEKLAHIITAVFMYTISVRNAPLKQAMG